MNPEDLPDYMKLIGKQIENRVNATFGDNDKSKKNADRDAQLNNENAGRIRMNANGYSEFEPDWEELDKRADQIVGGYTMVMAAGNVLPLPFDAMVVTATFAKMTTELAGVYQVIVSTKRARQIGWAISGATGSVLGLTFAASSLAKWVPGGYFAGVAVQASLVGAICWAAGDALKQYFKACRQGTEPDLSTLQELFAKTLHLKLKTVKSEVEKAGGLKTPAAPAGTPAAPTASATPVAPAEKVTVEDVLEKIAAMHELYRAGALSKDEYEKKKTELLKRL